MASVLCDSCREAEALPEFEDEFEDEGEFEDELEAEGEYEGEDEFEDEGEFGAIGNIVGSLLGEQEYEDELEGEDEFESEDELESEDESEAELSPIRKIYPDAMMEHLGELAAEAESEEEAAEHFLPLIGMAASKLLPIAAKALAPMAKKALPRIAKAITRVTPQLTRSVGKIARGLHRRPGMRGLLRTVPKIARRTVHSIAKQVAHGRRITPRSAVRTLANQTRRVLGSPAQRRHALRHHHRMERHLHRRFGRRMMRPHMHWRWRWVNGRRVRVPHRVAHGPGTAVRRGPAGTPGIYRPVSGAPGAPAAYRSVGAGPSAPGRVGVGRAPGVARAGRIVSGQCICPACPTCGGAVAPGTAVSAAAPSPSYCRCCGQLLR